jgi:nitrite reductase (NADH) large subunit
VVPQLPGGITSAAQLRKIADVVDKYRVPLVKLTGGQRIDLVGLRREDLPKIWLDLDMPSGHAYGKSYRTCKSCIGTEFCRYGLGDSMKLAQRIEARFAGIDAPAKMKLATAGCPRNCSEALVKDVGVVAIEGGKWEIYVGGAAGAHVRKGDLLCTVGSHEEVLRLASRFTQYYRENAKYLERTYAFVPRVGIEKLRSVVVDDSEGIARALDEAMQRSVDAYRDPWREASTPKTANQFASRLPIVQ